MQFKEGPSSEGNAQNSLKSLKIKWPIPRKFDVMAKNRYDFWNQWQVSHQNHSSECEKHSEHKILLACGTCVKRYFSVILTLSQS